MSELITHTARLVPYAKRPKQVPSFVTAYTHEPAADDPGFALGNLYVVIEVLIGGRSSEEVADLVIESFGEHYYNQGNEQTDPLGRFEAAVKATNHQLGEYVSQGNAAWIGKMSAVAVIQVGTELHITQTGSAEAILYRGKASTRIAGDGATRPTGPSKTFGSIASGALEPGDRLLLATPALIHQMALGKLGTIISGSSSNNAIAEITELLRGERNERIAALVIEVTTPEQAALQVRSEQPSVIQLGSPETPLAAAKMAAAPIAQATVASTKRVGGAAKSGWDRSRPLAQRAGQNAAGYLRDVLQTKGGRRNILIVAGVVVVAAVAFGWHASSAHKLSQLTERYSHDYASYQAADQAAIAGNKDAAGQSLTTLSAELAKLSKASGRSALDHKLGNSQLPNGEPDTVAGLVSLVSTRLDQINGLVNVSPTSVADLSEFKNAKPTHLEFADNHAYLVDSNNNSAIYVVNTTTNSVKKSAANTTKLGSVVATTLSASGNGMYLLTSKPSVWLYRFDTDSLTEQTTGLGAWEPAKAIASYGGNLYLLGDNEVYKHVPTYSGFSPKADYLTTSGAATGLAVDGSVYVQSSTGLREYLAGQQQAAASAPSNLTTITGLRSVDGGDLVIGTDATHGRIIVWNSQQKLAFSKQLAIKNAKSVTDAAYDAKSGLVYALADGKLVSLKLP